MSGAAVVVGATGFLGRNLVSALAAEDRPVIAVSGRGAPVPGAHRAVTLSELGHLDLPPETVVFHLAARRYDARTFAAEQPQVLADNVAITQQVYEICAAKGVGEVRLASSVAVYPASRVVMDDGEPLDLNGAPHAGEAFYAWSKRWGEILADLYRAKHGVSTVAFRITNPYGPHDTRDPAAAHVATAFVLRALEAGDQFLLRGRQVERDFVFAGDVADVFRRTAAWRQRHETYNLGSGVNTSLEQLARAVLAASGSEKPLVFAEAPASGPAQRRIDATRLQAAFPRTWTPLDAGLAATVAWARGDG
ncbi:NAD-dependent epimerase/dehydratase family protein [Phenylobacterium sp.]|uniref:NAD-dependent epimerase/dehydratase family protein n=1 Tax=Phenylobacterium sp. TaxID=1871053 RepID=UPI0035B32B9E